MSDRIRILLCMLGWTTVLLTACDGSSPNHPPSAYLTISPSSGPPPLTVTLDASASRDADGSIATYQWDFGSGVTANGRTVEHTYTETGVFVVRLTVADDDGATAYGSGRIVVNSPPLARIVADPVDGKAPVMVAFDAMESADEDGEIVSYEWDFDGADRASGATAEYTFAEPGVYEVRLTVTDDLNGVSEAVYEVNARDAADVAFTVPYVPDATYAEQLRPCTYGSANPEGCILDQLPFLGMEHSSPTVDDVMERVLVSHRWMGDAFREALEQFPEDMRLLARSVTAIVIASDIVPAHYSPASGAIYLDAEFFWRTLEERAVRTTKLDPRIGYGSTIPLYIPWRQVRNNTMLRLWVPPGESRLELPLHSIASLLYHELSHASDFVRASRLYDDVDGSQTVWEMAVADYQLWPSWQLSWSHPLTSGVIHHLAAVFFNGAPPTPELESLHPDDIVEDFVRDGAVDFYSYSSRYEALADVHDSLLMSLHHGYEKDVGIVGREEAESMWDSVVAWGQRGRMTDPLVIGRARRVIDLIYPGDKQALHGYLSARPAPLPMRRGDTWGENLILDGGADFNDAPPAVGRLKSRTGVVMGQHTLAMDPFGNMSKITRRDSEHGSSGDGVGRSGRLVGCILVPEGVSDELLEQLGLQ